MYREGERELIQAELASARAARKGGLEGRARVCSRRAFVIAIRAYLRDKGFTALAGNAITIIDSFSTFEDVPEELRIITKHLLLRVDEAFQLPPEIDLISETKLLIDRLETLNKSTGSG